MQDSAALSMEARAAGAPRILRFHQVEPQKSTGIERRPSIRTIYFVYEIIFEEGVGAKSGGRRAPRLRSHGGRGLPVQRIA
jgi:hypothetical protein